MKPFSLSAIALLGCGMVAQTPPAAPPQAVFRAGVSAVRVDVQVEENRRILRGLTAPDFIVTDNGVTQTITQFGHENEPLSLALLLDVSGSMQTYLKQISSTAREALGHLLPGDRVAVMLFSLRTAVHEPFTDNHAVAARALDPKGFQSAALGAGTAINSAILDAAKYTIEDQQSLPFARRGRRAILMLTDNFSLNYQVPDEKAIQALFAADIVFNAIVVGKGHKPPPIAPGTYTNPDFTPADVFRIADETGGEAIRVERAGEAFAGMLERIRSRYTLLYSAPPAAPGTFRQIHVELAPAARARYPKAVVRARSGYYVTRE
ncbi:MAG: VWA domain-containing protein [Bryobacterales bacterium]|nr:VWA domain-containing protein [Bryobacterales bacterium]